MGIDVTDLNALDPGLVLSEQARITQLMQEAFPTVDLRRGVYHDHVLHLAAALSALVRTEIDRQRRSMSLAAITADPTLADPDVVDAVLSNFRITRSPGGAATGSVTIVLDGLVPVTVSADTTFAAGGVTFAASQAYAARVNAASVASATDQVLRPLGDGRYAFTIPVTALATGAAGLIRRGTPVTPSAAIPHFTAAYAEGDFSGGYDAATNADMLRQLQQGLSVQAWSNRASVDAMVHGNAAFARVLQTSITGFGDPEMTRDQHTIFPVSAGGRCDVWARTDLLPAEVTLAKTCVFTGPSGGGGIWQFSVGRDEAPGFYRVARVALASAAPDDDGFEIRDDVRGFDLGADPWTPDVTTAAEAAFSRFQTTTVRFFDPVTPVAGLTANASTAPYQVAVMVMPGVAALQGFLGGRAVRNPGGDVLVRAPVPCLLSVNFDVLKRAADATPDVAPVAAALAQFVNGTGFAGQLAASRLVEVIQANLPAGMAAGAVDMWGKIVRPDGGLTYVRSQSVLAVPDDPGRLVTARTVCFFLAPQDVGITVVDVDVPEV